MGPIRSTASSTMSGQVALDMHLGSIITRECMCSHSRLGGGIVRRPSMVRRVFIPFPWSHCRRCTVQLCNQLHMGWKTPPAAGAMAPRNMGVWNMHKMGGGNNISPRCIRCKGMRKMEMGITRGTRRQVMLLNPSGVGITLPLVHQ